MSLFVYNAGGAALSGAAQITQALAAAGGGPVAAGGGGMMAGIGNVAAADAYVGGQQ